MIALVVVFSMSHSSFAEDTVRTFGNPALDDLADPEAATSDTDEADQWLDVEPGDLNSPDGQDKALDEIARLVDEEKGLPLIPEPNTLVLLALAALLLLLWRLKW